MWTCFSSKIHLFNCQAAPEKSKPLKKHHLTVRLDPFPFGSAERLWRSRAGCPRRRYPCKQGASPGASLATLAAARPWKRPMTSAAVSEVALTSVTQNTRPWPDMQALSQPKATHGGNESPARELRDAATCESAAVRPRCRLAAAGPGGWRDRPERRLPSQSLCFQARADRTEAKSACREASLAKEEQCRGRRKLLLTQEASLI